MAEHGIWPFSLECGRLRHLVGGAGVVRAAMRLGPCGGMAGRRPWRPSRLTAKRGRWALEDTAGMPIRVEGLWVRPRRVDEPERGLQGLGVGRCAFGGSRKGLGETGARTPSLSVFGRRDSGDVPLPPPAPDRARRLPREKFAERNAARTSWSCGPLIGGRVRWARLCGEASDTPLRRRLPAPR